MSKKFLDYDGLSHFWLLIKNKLGGKVDKEFKTGSTSAYKVLSDNNLTDALLTKIQNAGDSSFSGNFNDLHNIPDSFNPSAHTHKKSEITDLVLPTKTSDLTNDSGYQTATQVNTAIQAVVGAAPDALNTLKELADALGNNANFSATVTTELGKKLNAADLVAITNDEIDTTCA